jgi:hypothetical protein
MSQQILFKRSADIYSNRTAAIEKLNTLTWAAGEPIIANYYDNGETRILFAIGIANRVGSQGYRIISDFETVSQLITSLDTLSKALESHEGSLVSGENAGHVINDETSDIEFTNGIGKLKQGSLAL